ncbi:ligase [Moraxella nasovis]|uniref:biotin--[acetyl-CoA-carboxylase] ligase n=1 Tax=Moraxella nasovis TaxID=2904121 RepID=UPI001F61EDDC|nr:ligase [Moraxella nasovis]UNU73850.1 ligase [Moraxella nasovis]
MTNQITTECQQIIAHRHRHFDIVGSTNTQLMTDISTGKLPYTYTLLYTANTQNAGRGQHGRTWESGTDNVFLSLYTPITYYSDSIGLDKLSGLLSLLVGLHLLDIPIIASLNAKRHAQKQPTIGIKWANDLGFYDEIAQTFFKLSGILIEPVFFKLQGQSQLVGVIIGVGMNVKNTPVIKDKLYQAISLHNLSEDTPSAQALYLPITQAILQAILHHNTLSHTQNTAIISQFITQFNTHHVLTGQSVQIFPQNNKEQITHQGKCLGIDLNGALLVQCDKTDTIQAVFAGTAQITPYADKSSTTPPYTDVIT